MSQINVAPGEAELIFQGLGFDGAKLRDDDYLEKAVAAVGGLEQLEKVQKSFRELLNLPRPRLVAELATRITQQEFAAKRDLLPKMGQAEIASQVLLAECKARFQFTFGELSGLA